MEGLKSPSLKGTPEHVQILSFNQLEKNGEDSGEAPSNKGVCITGVLINQEQVVAAIQAFNDLGYDVVDAMYVAYLPLSHIYELVVETKFGYIKYVGEYHHIIYRPGEYVNYRDRIRKNIEENIAKRGQLVKAFFEFALEYKTSWYSSGYSTPLLDRILFRKTSRLVGGRCKVMGSGGAPISQETQEFTQGRAVPRPHPGLRHDGDHQLRSHHC
ncbi:ACSL4 [Cordylochernes scorpioides]|uniref:ACSL4 n=1 Tax=Cordylochernes scorpioides TaxID=51811 RepID=A0ABY6KVY3_9ARAC|nr:ACSL4 [Cordylochernes scorpioides]